jgi:hypothetical protein
LASGLLLKPNPFTIARQALTGCGPAVGPHGCQAISRAASLPHRLRLRQRGYAVRARFRLNSSAIEPIYSPRRKGGSRAVRSRQPHSSALWSATCEFSRSRGHPDSRDGRRTC